MPFPPGGDSLSRRPLLQGRWCCYDFALETAAADGEGSLDMSSAGEEQTRLRGHSRGTAPVRAAAA